MLRQQTGELDGLAVATSDDRFHDHFRRRLTDSLSPALGRIAAMCEPDTAGQLARDRDLLLTLPRPELEHVVTHPLFNYYWLQFVEAIGRRDITFVRDWARHLSRFALCPATVETAPAGHVFHLPLVDGTTHLPLMDFDLCVDAPRDAGSHLTVVIGDAADAADDGQVVLDRHFLRGAGDASGPVRRRTRVRDAGHGVPIDASDPWTHRLLSSMNGRGAAAGYPVMDLAPLVPTPADLPEQVTAALDLIAEAWPEAYQEMRRYLRLVVPYTSGFHSSFTESCTMGAIYLSEAMRPFSSVLFTAEHILHEVAHLRLTLIQELEALVEAAPDTTFHPPWRKDARPLSGTLQGIFAFGRMAGLHRRALALTGDPAHGARHAEIVTSLTTAMAEVDAERAVVLTPSGRAWWRGLRAEAEVGS